VPNRKANSSQAAWALLTEGVTAARLEAHRLRHLVTRAEAIIAASSEREHINEVAGDIIQGIPARLEVLERHLDRTTYALSKLGEDHLRERLPLSDRKQVDEAVHQAKPLGGPVPRARTEHVIARYLSRMADKYPALGWPGGSCQLYERIRSEVRNPKEQEGLVDKVEEGETLSNPEAAKVYDVDLERGPGGKIKKIIISSHAQYRMDQRGILVPQLRVFFEAFLKDWSDRKSRGDPLVKRWEAQMAYGDPINWTDRKLGLTVVFVLSNDAVRIVTLYWEGDPDPRPVPESQCIL